MKRYLTFIIFMTITAAAFAQDRTAEKKPIYWTEISKAQIAPFIDSLRANIINDTAKLNIRDLSNYGGEIRNKNGYSKLFVIDKYLYRLDIISGEKVMEFLKEFFVPESIETISVFSNTAGATAIYGSRADLGAIAIKMKKRTKYNPNVAGLNSKVRPNNFIQDLPHTSLRTVH